MSHTEQPEPTSDTVPPFAWDRETAAVLLADDELTDVEVGNLVGVSDRTLRRWKVHPEIRARITELARELAAVGPRRATAKRNRRLQFLDSTCPSGLNCLDRGRNWPGRCSGAGGFLTPDEPMATGKLTSRQERFCAEYIKDLNATAAYRRANPGVSYRAGNSNAARLLANTRSCLVNRCHRRRKIMARVTMPT